MSSVTSAYQNTVQSAARNAAGTSGYKPTAANAAAAGRAEAPPHGDSVEISAEARSLLKESEPEKDWVNVLQPAKKLLVGSEEYDKFRALMETVKEQKSGLLSRITAALGKKGIDPASLGKIKIEIDKSGKAMVGGIEDKALAAAVERALNDDPGLAAEIAGYQKNEKELSAQMTDYAGASLYELTMTARGDTSERVRKAAEQDGKYDLNPDYYMTLGFLGGAGTFISREDVAALSFEGNMDFSGEISVMSNPEGGIKDAMNGMFEKVTKAFEELNAGLRDSLKAAGIELSDEDLSKRLLNAANAEITVDNRGMVQVGGMLSGDKAANAKGIAIIGQLVREMLVEAGKNSYGVNLFTAASQGLIDKKVREEGGSADARVVATMRFGRVKDIDVESRNTTNKLEQQLQDALKRASGHIRK